MPHFQVRAEPGARVYRWNVGLFTLALLSCWAAWWRMGGQWFEPGFNTSGMAAMGIALITGTRLVWVERDRAVPPSSRWLLVSAALLVAYALCYGTTPRLVTAILAAALAATMLLGILPPSVRAGAWGILPWMLASLPLGVAFNLYFGYPLRVAVGAIASVLLARQVTPLGTGLSDGVHTVFIDAPCAGIQMMRIAFLLAGVVAVMCRLRLVSTFLLCGAAFVLAILGNALRVALLFLLSRRGDLSEASHTWSGVGIFAGCAIALVVLGAVLARRPGAPGAARMPAPRPRFLLALSRSLFLLAVLPALLVPLAVADRGHERGDSVPWPTTVDGETLVIGPPDPTLAEYESTFLGTMAQGRLLPSGRLVLLRQCVEPTLTLHTSENCYLVAGFQCAALPAERDAQGHLWSRFSATHDDGRAYVVKQCFFDIDGAIASKSNTLEDWTEGRESWPDSSSWYWAAARPGASVSLTMAITIAEREED